MKDLIKEFIRECIISEADSRVNSLITKAMSLVQKGVNPNTAIDMAIESMPGAPASDKLAKAIWGQALKGAVHSGWKDLIPEWGQYIRNYMNPTDLGFEKDDEEKEADTDKYDPMDVYSSANGKLSTAKATTNTQRQNRFGKGVAKPGTGAGGIQTNRFPGGKNVSPVGAR